MNIPYFEKPTQVRFYEVEQEKYIGGIGYNDEIICGCCGGVISIEGLFEEVPEDIIPIVSYEHWINIEEEITGGFFDRGDEVEEEDGD